MISYKDIATRTSLKAIHTPDKQNQNTTSGISSLKHRRNRREPLTLDALREIFIDTNMDEFINLHESLVDKYSMFGYLNKSETSKLTHAIVDSLIINNSVVLTDAQSNYILSDDEGK